MIRLSQSLLREMKGSPKKKININTGAAVWMTRYPPRPADRRAPSGQSQRVT